jgi:flagella basal body P-ring formation protein FlgA
MQWWANPDKWLKAPLDGRKVQQRMQQAVERQERGKRMSAMAGLAMGGLCLLLALVKITPASGDEANDQQLTQIYTQVERQVKEKIGVDVVVMPIVNGVKPRLPESYDSFSLRYPNRKGTVLPDMLQFYYQDRLVSNMNLRRYVDFNLPVVQANTEIPAYSAIDSAWLDCSSDTVSPGSEVLLNIEEATGMLSRLKLRTGDRLQGSRLQLPYDIARGQSVTLLIKSGGVEAVVEATAAGNAYVGQRISVRRNSDNQRFSGLVKDGPVVVIEERK